MPKFGSKLVYTSAISFAAPSYAAECLAAKQAGATSMTVGDATQVVNKVVQDCAAQGYTPIQLSADGTVGIRGSPSPVQRQRRRPTRHSVLRAQRCDEPDVHGTKKYYPASSPTPTSVRS